MYARIFEKAGQVKRFTITSAHSAGWEVCEEESGTVVWRAQYTDWHKVERARLTFSREASTLASAGWRES
jgi:hypothetical protein